MRGRLLEAAVGILETPLSVFACPLCDGVAGRNPVKEEIFTERFWYFGLATVLPFAVCLAVVLWMSAGPSIGNLRRAPGKETELWVES
jgi:hypothetical protein